MLQFCQAQFQLASQTDLALIKVITYPPPPIPTLTRESRDTVNKYYVLFVANILSLMGWVVVVLGGPVTFIKIYLAVWS